MKQNSFKQKERLKSKKYYSTIFSQGSVLAEYPIKVLWIESDEPQNYHVEIGVTIPKKKFRRATQRNLIRRRIEEIYRQNNYYLYNSLKKQQKQLKIVIIYVAKYIYSYKEIESSLVKALNEISRIYENDI